jgi:hypothetical protein
MRERLSPVCALLALTVLTMGAAAAEPADLLVNGDFETPPVGVESTGKLPPHWVKAYGTPKILSIIEDARPGSPGTHCLQIAASADSRMGGAYSDFIAIDPQQGLEVSGWVKPGAGDKPFRGLYFGVAYYDAAKKPIILVPDTQLNYIYLPRAAATGEWTRMSTVLAPKTPQNSNRYTAIPPATAFVQVRVFALNRATPGWFDDISVRQLPAAEAAKRVKPAPRARARKKGGNLPLNPVTIDSDWVVAWVGERAAAAAALTMKEHLEKVLGTQVVATPWQATDAPHVFVITDAQHAPAVAPRLAGKKRDAFVIDYPAQWEGRTVCLLVARDEKAYDFPVYHFLRTYMGVDWVGPGELGIVFREQSDWQMPPAIDVFDEPAYEHRMWSGNSFRSREWLARSGRMGFHHALGNVFSPSKHGDTPEVYPLIKGKRYVPPADGKHRSAGWQPCTANPKSVEIAAAHVVELYQRQPPPVSVSLSVNDGAGNICECDLCRAQDRKGAFEQGKRPDLSDRFFRFYNAAMEKALAEAPDARVAVLGYGPSKQIPSEVRIHERIQVFEVAPTIEKLRAWKAAGATPNIYLWLWDGGFLTVRPDMHVIGDIVKAGAELGALGLYSEIIAHWVVAAPKFYILASLLWDPSGDVDVLLDDYCRLAYGGGGDAVARYFRRWWEIYRRYPEDQWHATGTGWRSAEQMQHVRRNDLAVLDKAMTDAAAAELSERQRQRLEHLITWHELTATNAREYLAGIELADAEWRGKRSPAAILRLASDTVGLTATFNAQWKKGVEEDRSGWLLDERYYRNPGELWQKFVVSLRSAVSSKYETALDAAIADITARLVKDGGTTAAAAFWEKELAARPELAAYIGPALNKLKGVIPPNIVVNGGFDDGTPGDAASGAHPVLPGWEFYEDYGMVKGVNARYRWASPAGANGKAVAFGEGRYPEMKAIIKLEAGHRYALSFRHRTENVERKPSFWLFTYDGELETSRDIERGKINQFMVIRLAPTEGEWAQTERVFSATHDGTHILMVVSYYHKADTWTWWDDVAIRKIW